MNTPSQNGSPGIVKVIVMLVVPVLIFAIAACDNGSSTKSARAPYEGVPEGKPTNIGAPVPDPKETLDTRSSGQLPDFISTADASQRDKISKLYQGAIQHYDVYSHIPCYCGCAIYTTAHKSLADCYIKSEAADGSITFTDHSMSCDLCQAAAQMTVDGIAANTPVKDIRAAIFNKLKYTGIWTDTPLQ